MSHALPSNALAFKRRLLRWYRRYGRELPWRKTRDPYRVLVSEVMLQQTQVGRVLHYYPRFLARFPDVDTLAAAPPRRVREAWEGLGYYRRATNLHRLARVVARRYNGAIPSDPAVLRRLPGVGPYTAGAVASFAYHRRSPAVDTNVARVLDRVFSLRGTPPGGRAPKGGTASRQVWELAGRLLPRRRHAAWEFNQALMDLGALFCTARNPKCGVCPVRPTCATGRTLSGPHR